LRLCGEPRRIGRVPTPAFAATKRKLPNNSPDPNLDHAVDGSKWQHFLAHFGRSCRKYPSRIASADPLKPEKK
jgi:hypothetical protein